MAEVNRVLARTSFVDKIKFDAHQAMHILTLPGDYSLERDQKKCDRHQRPHGSFQFIRILRTIKRGDVSN